LSDEGVHCNSSISERVGNTVAVVDTNSRETIARIPVGNAPKRVLVVELPEVTESGRK